LYNVWGEHDSRVPTNSNKRRADGGVNHGGRIPATDQTTWGPPPYFKGKGIWHKEKVRKG